MLKIKKAFTLIELLVVIAIISLLVSILLPSLAKAKELAASVICKSNLKSIAYGHSLYSTDYDGILPPAYDASTEQKWWMHFLAKQDFDDSEGYLPAPGSWRGGDGDAARMWTCPTAVKKCLNNGAADSKKIDNTYLRISNFAHWNALTDPNNCAGWIKLELVDNPGGQMFAIDGQMGTAEPNLASGGYTMSGQLVGLKTGWQHYLTLEALDFLCDGYPVGMMDFLHQEAANVLFADWHVEAVNHDEITYDMFENPN